MERKGKKLNKFDDKENIQLPCCNIEIPQQSAKDVKELDFELFFDLLHAPFLVGRLTLGIKRLRIVFFLQKYEIVVLHL